MLYEQFTLTVEDKYLERYCLIMTLVISFVTFHVWQVGTIHSTYS